MANSEDQRELLKRAVAAVQELRSRLNAEEQKSREPIAIVGLGCRLPGGADSPAAFWHLLDSGTDAVSEIPPARLSLNGLYDPNPDAPGKVATRRGAFLKEIDKFDAAFFGVSPREAVQMDPQQRLLLEVSWEALEDAGQTNDALARSATGAFIGAISPDYMWRQLNDPECIDAYSGTGTHTSLLSGRISYSLDLRGPSLTLDTACSSSLVAVHLACQSLRQRECDMAIAGGVNLVTDPVSLMSFSRMGLLAPDGICKTFDARADGFVGGEGCAVVILKRLSDAVAQRDNIRAVIRGSAVNQDGRSSTLTAPNGPSQVEVISRSLANAGVSADSVTYVEAHGTGTALGDAIELEALKSVFDAGRGAPPCAAGSVKTNIGHLGAAAGIAGLVKAVLSLEHRRIPRHLHFHHLNPHVSLDDSRLFVPVKPLDWTDSRGPLTAGVSSFGWSGTNAHLVLQQAPENPVSAQPVATTETYILPLSARSPEALSALAAAYSKTLSGEELLADVCFTAAVRRTHHKYRLAVTGESVTQLIEKLNGLDLEATADSVLQSGVAFVFSGQGGQWQGMGLELHAREKVFRDSLDETDALVRARTGWSILDRITQPDALDDTAFAQPVIFALQVALVRLWQFWGIEPSAVVGHSMGEIAAAHISGTLSLEDAVTVAINRGRRMQAAAGTGAMAEIGSTQAPVEFPNLTIAARNGPNSIVLAGDPGELKSAIELLEARGIRCTMLHGNYAFHSPQMDPYVAPVVRDLHALKLRPASLPVYSTVHGGRASGDDFNAQYWGRNIRMPVLFSAALAAMIDEGYRCFLEIGPHPALSPAIHRLLEERNATGSALPSLRRKRPERASMLESLAALYCAGARVRFSNVTGARAHFRPLPNYPWQRKRYWLDVARAAPTGIASYEVHRERYAPASALDVDAAATRRNWILFEAAPDRPHSLATALAKHLEAAGAVCLRSALKIESLDAVLGTSPGEWNVLLACPDASPPESAAALTRDALLLSQRCLASQHRIRLWFLTRTGLADAPLLGFGRTLAVESPELWGGTIDVVPGPQDYSTSILTAIVSPNADKEFAIDPTGTWVPRLAKVSAQDVRQLTVRSDKTYLITGGLGEIGIAIARALAAAGARHLLLFGRGEPSEAAAIAVSEMEAGGVSCTLRRGDVTSPRDLADAISACGVALPELAGTVHAAGCVNDAIVASMTEEQLLGVLAPKVDGAWNLHRATLDRPLDFFVAISSLASVLGSAGQAAYAAANAFLDRLAYYRHGLGLCGLTINWGPWAGTRMTTRVPERARERWAHQGITPLSPAQGAASFIQLAATEAAQRCVAIVDWELFRRARPESSAIATNLVASPLGVEPIAPAERELSISDWLRHKTSRILKSEVSPARSLIDQGFDSLMAMELLRAVHQKFQIRIFPREFYQRPFIETFAAYISNELAGRTEAEPSRVVFQSNAPRAETLNKLQTPIVFLLSAPRSGSTLLRVMLAGHPDLFCPPELHLLGFQTLAERSQALQGSSLAEGLIRAIKELKGCSTEEARAVEREWVSADLSVQAAYGRLQEMANGRLLVDKSPSYAASPDTLQRAEELFSNARYIHLVRHPLSVIDSFVRNRFDRLLGLTDKSPRETAEDVWAASNRNLAQFLEDTDRSRSMVVRYEDLVRNPERVMDDLCSFLAIPFKEAMLKPYEGTRMTDGLHAQSAGIGDPGFLAHDRIDASLADAWQSAPQAPPPGQETRKLAAKFNYRLTPAAAPHAGMREQFLTVRGLSLCLCSWGSPEAPPILILHGLLDHAAAWEEVAMSLAARGFSVHVPDQRGHGRSQHVGPEGSYYLLDFLADANALLKQIATQPVVLVGHSMGASVASMLAAARPAEVRRLVLVESVLASGSADRKVSGVLATHLNTLEAGTTPQVFTDAALAVERLRQFYPSMDVSQATKMADRLLEPCSGGVRWRWDPRLRTQAAFDGPFDLVSLLGEIRVPVTLLSGTESEFTSPERTATQLAVLNEGREAILRGGHNLHLDCPLDLAEAIAGEVAPEAKA
jgi:acyl transferase domain-containing protein/pimeloyl-ACP methyl ester carboxylesterase/acyl carrier protein